MVHVNAVIEIDEEKHGGLVVKIDGKEMGDLGIDPVYEINAIKDMMKVRMKIGSGKIVEDLNSEIVRRLALLLAWYLLE